MVFMIFVKKYYAVAFKAYERRGKTSLELHALDNP
jgi:hypothetical protein